MTSNLFTRWLWRLAPLIAFSAFVILALNRQCPWQSECRKTQCSNERFNTSVNKIEFIRRSNLKVESDPTGASLLMNGRLIGATPLVLTGLERGRHSLRLERDGCQPKTRYIDLSDDNISIMEKLDSLPTATLNIEIEPKDAEVLLDGEFIGYTPLQCSHISVGAHELLIRKTNYESYSEHIMIEPDMPAVFAKFELKDKILDMLALNRNNEPQRLAHYLDLGHYLFLNDKMEEAANVFAQGLEVMQNPLDFDGQGFSGKAQMSAMEINIEQRLRKEDEMRLLKEIERHRNYPRKNTSVFKKKMDAAQEIVMRRNIASWTWIDRVARLYIKGKNYERAVKIYLDHIAAAPKTPDLPQAYTALLEVYLLQHDMIAARKTFDQFYALFQDDSSALQTCSDRIAACKDRISGAQGRQQLLEMSEQARHRSLELKKMLQKNRH